MKSGERKVYRIAELTRLIKTALENAFGEVWVEGEISNLRRPSSGHLYFTVKDATSQLSAVMFRGNQTALKFQPADGMLVQACGQISVYERSGNYQMIVRVVEEAGKGSLQAAFEALKKKLQAEGLFEKERKKPLPILPRNIGVVTSPTGAAIRDILKVLSGRCRNVHVLIAPVRVQGEGAGGEIAAAVRSLNARGGLDVLIVGRGGGSMEDLWCFNEEIVVRAIAESRIPVISAVGHEIDFTISDFVADVRAPTPTAAAEIIVNLREDQEQRVDELGLRMSRPLREELLRARNRLTAAGGSYVFAEPRNVAQRYRQRMNEFKLRIRHSLEGRVRETEQGLDDAGLRIVHAVRKLEDASKQNVRRLEVQLRALSPLAVLVRGYSITRDEHGAVLRSTDKLRKGRRVFTRLSEGEFESEVVVSEEHPAR